MKNNNALYDSKTLCMIRSIVDELYQINKDEIRSRNNSPRFTDDDLPSIQCHCATQTISSRQSSLVSSSMSLSTVSLFSK